MRFKKYLNELIYYKIHNLREEDKELIMKFIKGSKDDAVPGIRIKGDYLFTPKRNTEKKYVAMRTKKGKIKLGYVSSNITKLIIDFIKSNVPKNKLEKENEI